MDAAQGKGLEKRGVMIRCMTETHIAGMMIRRMP